METVSSIFHLIGSACFAVCGLLCLLWLRRVLLRYEKSRYDRSLWMWCEECNVKWRPTAYGPPAPDDRYCPLCEETTNVRTLIDLCNKVPRFENGVRKQPPTERSSH